MNCKILLTLLFVSLALHGMDAPPMQLARSCQTNSSKRTPQMGDESDDYAKRLRRHRGENTFICPECVKQCDSVNTLHSHIILKHTKYRPYECTDCKYKAAFFPYLIEHMKSVHKKNMPPTISLETQKQVAKALSPFLRKMDWSVTCFECDLLFPSFKSLEVHQHKHKTEFRSEVNAKKNPEAPAQPEASALSMVAQGVTIGDVDAETGMAQENPFQDESHPELNRAQKRIEKDRYTCPECANIYNQLYSLHSHILKIHAKDRPYECTHCKHRTHSPIRLNDHLKLIHKQSTPLAISVETQKKVAALLAPFLNKMGWSVVCSECDLLFPSSKSLTSHRKLHYTQLRAVENQEEIIIVPDYPPSPSLTSDIHPETEPAKETTLQGTSGANSDKAQKPVERSRHTCPECVNVYDRIPSLHSHILFTHIKALPYECTYCEFKTVALKLLTSHMNRIHKQTVPRAITAETQKKVAALLTPFLKKMGWDAVCSECDLLFPTPSSLTIHQNAHYKQLRTVENKGEIITAPDYLPSPSPALVNNGSTFDLLAGENELNHESEIDFGLFPQILEGADSLNPVDLTHDGTDEQLDYSLLALTPLPGTPAAAHAMPNGITDKIGITQQPSPHSDQLPEIEFDSEILADKEDKEPLLEPIVEKDTTQELTVPQLTWVISPRYRGPFSCPEPGCSYLDQSTEKFKHHILKKHIPFTPYCCAVPDCTFKPTNLLNVLNKHIRHAHRSNNNFIASAQTSKKITHHLNEVLKKLGWEHACKTCEELFPTQISLQNHTNKGHKRRGTHE